MLADSTGVTFEQMRSAHHQALVSAGAADEPSKLLGHLRWRTLRVAGPLREMAQRAEVGPLPLAGAHAADGLQRLLGVCAEGQDFQHLITTSPAALKKDMMEARESFTYAIANIDILLRLLSSVDDLFSS